VQMLAHGLATGALFVMAGVLQSRLGTRELSVMGGLWQRAPRMGGVTLFLAIAALGLPGLGSFVGEFLVLLGGFQTAAWPAAIAAGGFVIAAVYALSLMQRAFLGAAHDLPRGIDAIADLDARELGMTGAMMAGLIWLGLHPQPFLDISAGALTELQRLTGAA
jgi:NADH-quinone oxidoreductase subunit M